MPFVVVSPFTDFIPFVTVNPFTDTRPFITVLPLCCSCSSSPCVTSSASVSL